MGGARRGRWAGQAEPPAPSLWRQDSVAGEKKLADFLTTIQTADTIRALGRKLGYTDGTIRSWLEKRDEMLGAAVLGEKMSRYFACIMGLDMDGSTVDVWMARAGYRQLGRLIKEGEPKCPEAPRSPRDRQLFMRTDETLAKEFGLPTRDIQAVRWFYEKELYRSLGFNTADGWRSHGTLKYLEDNGIAQTYTRNRRRQNDLSDAARSAPGAGGGAQPDATAAPGRGARATAQGPGEEEVSARRLQDRMRAVLASLRPASRDGHRGPAAGGRPSAHHQHHPNAVRRLTDPPRPAVASQQASEQFFKGADSTSPRWAMSRLCS